MQADNSPAIRDKEQGSCVFLKNLDYMDSKEQQGCWNFARAFLGRARPEPTPTEVQECLCIPCITLHVPGAG